MSKTAAKKLERMESIVIGAGFLLQRLYTINKHTLSYGLEEQIRQCLNDCNQVVRNKQAREKQKPSDAQIAANGGEQ